MVNKVCDFYTSRYVCVLAAVPSPRPKNPVLTQAAQNELVLCQITDVLCKLPFLFFYSSSQCCYCSHVSVNCAASTNIVSDFIHRNNHRNHCRWKHMVTSFSLKHPFELTKSWHYQVHPLTDDMFVLQNNVFVGRGPQEHNRFVPQIITSSQTRCVKFSMINVWPYC